MNELYLYFRTQGTLASDTQDDDSCLFRLSNFKGMQSSASSQVYTVTLKFRSLRSTFDMGSHVNSDTVDVTLASGFTPKEFMEDFTKAVNTAKGKQNKFFVVGDDATSEYFSKSIASIGTIAIANPAS
jgi:hypothetical protein